MPTGKRQLAGVAAFAVIAAAISAWLCHRVLGAQPHVADEVSYLFQGRILATGRLWMIPPKWPALFEFDHIVTANGKWCSIYPSGWPLLLAAGWLVHAPWILNPLLFSLSVIGTWRLASLLFDARTAWTALILFACSPFVLLMHSGFMAHPAALCAAVWCAVCVVQATDQNRYGFAAGLLAGFCFLVRPATAVCLLWPLPLWICRQSRSARLLLRFLAGAVPGLLLYLLYNWQVFGHPLQSGYPLDPTYHVDKITAASFTGNLIWYFRSLNRWMWEWPWPGLVIFAPLILQRSKWPETKLLAACALSLMIGYSFFYYHDIVYAGPRYVFEGMAFLVILAARAWVVLIERFSARAGAGPVAALLLAALSLNRLPAQMEFHSQMYHSRSHQLVEAVRQSAIGKRALIMIGGNPYVYGSFFLQNALDPDAGDRVFVREIAGQERDIVNAYPREEAWEVTIEMQPIPGPNTYPDRWKLTHFAITRLNSRR